MTHARRGPDVEDVRIYAVVDEPGPAIYLLLAWSLLAVAVVASVALVLMARALKASVEAGRLAYLAGRMQKRRYAVPSSPLAGLI